MAIYKVAFQGERGAFSEVAASLLIKGEIKAVPCISFDELFDKVEKRSANFGVIPIENSLIGSIHRNYDLLLERNLKVIGETQLRIIHSLITSPKTTFAKIKKVYSHPAALDQCRKFFAKHKNIEPISYYDTAGAVKKLAESDLTDSAAIASPFAAELYNMKRIRKSIEDEKSNFTRFLLLGRKPINISDNIKTSVVFSLKNLPGALFKALSVFALRDIDLTKIESRPARKYGWKYYFYVDFIGSQKEDHIKNALNHLREITHFQKILGSYPSNII
ncbi:MAG: prephenate dehydratase [candidate division Zixibacteria bacterium]|nr:prephenate dehydratase [candidate division Zixibacteria bacterium]